MMYEETSKEKEYSLTKRIIGAGFISLLYAPVYLLFTLYYNFPLWGIILYSLLPALVVLCLVSISSGIEVVGHVNAVYLSFTYAVMVAKLHWSIPVLVFIGVMGFHVLAWSKYFEDKTFIFKKKIVTHGSAEFASSINNHRSEKGKQFLLGRFVYENGEKEKFYQSGHMLTCAPSGAGKGIGVVVPNLLEYEGSIFCVDIKGENYCVTADYRRSIGQKTILLDPFNVVPSGDYFSDTGKDSYNIIDWLKSFPEDITSDSQMIAESLIVSTGGESDFWNDSAKDMLRGIIAYTTTLENGSLGEVRRILTLSKDAFEDAMATMQTCGVTVCERCANTILSMDEKTRAGVLSTAQQQTAFLDEDRITNCLSYSSFDLSAFKNGSISFYLVMPPERLANNFRLIRLFISLLITSVTRIKEKPENPALFLFDEFAQLGRMTILEVSLSLIRGYGASYWFFIHDLSRFKAVYQKWQTFLANTTKQFFSTADYDTAKYISDMLGQTTEGFITHSSNSSSSVSGSGSAKSQSYSSGSSSSENRMARNLLNPDEVMRLPSDDVLVFTRGEDAYKLKRVNYLTDEDFSGLFKDNPMH